MKQGAPNTRTDTQRTVLAAKKGAVNTHTSLSFTQAVRKASTCESTEAGGVLCDVLVLARMNEASPSTRVLPFAQACSHVRTYTVTFSTHTCTHSHIKHTQTHTHLVQRGCCEHEAREHGAPNHATQRVPRLVVEPVPELVGPLCHQLDGGAVAVCGGGKG